MEQRRLNTALVIMTEALSAADICARYGSPMAPPSPDDMLGVALATVGAAPLNALRHPSEGGTYGWFIWGGEELSSSPDFFQPLHVMHLAEYAPQLMPFLALAPGWRVLLAPGQVDVWFDAKLLVP